MFGYRTPRDAPKKQTSKSPQDDDPKKSTEGAGPHTNPNPLEAKVRRSRMSGTRKNKLLLPLNDDKPKAKLSTTTLEDKSSSQKIQATTSGAEKSPKRPTKYKSRTAEAEACLQKAKIQMDKSRNIRRDNKADVLEAVERLYTLVKEAERAQAHETGEQALSTTEPDPLVTQMKEHSKKLEEHTRKMDELKLDLETQN